MAQQKQCSLYAIKVSRPQAFDVGRLPGKMPPWIPPPGMAMRINARGTHDATAWYDTRNDKAVSGVLPWPWGRLSRLNRPCRGLKKGRHVLEVHRME